MPFNDIEIEIKTAQKDKKLSEAVKKEKEDKLAAEMNASGYVDEPDFDPIEFIDVSSGAALASSLFKYLFDKTAKGAIRKQALKAIAGKGLKKADAEEVVFSNPDFKDSKESLEKLRGKIADYDSDNNLTGVRELSESFTNRTANPEILKEVIKKKLTKNMENAQNFRKQTQAAREQLMSKKDLTPAMRREQMAKIEQQEQMIEQEIGQIRSMIMREGGSSLLKEILRNK